MKMITALFVLFVMPLNVHVIEITAQSSPQGMNNFLALPSVFKLGEHSQQYEELLPGYQMLIEACGNDMKSAHAKVYSMMKEMEAFAKVMDYDLDGVKAWLHFFFSEDGTIQHIGFHLKPNSKNVDTTELGIFLKNFSKQYKFPQQSEFQYSHYSSFSFPVF